MLKRSCAWLLVGALSAACGGDDAGTDDAPPSPPDALGDGGQPDADPMTVSPDANSTNDAAVPESDAAPAPVTSVDLDKLSEVPRPKDTQDFGWKPCAENTMQCGTLRLPIDYSNSEAGSVKVAITRRLASGKRLGALFMNPGGPGSSAIDFLDFFVLDNKSPLLQHFDLVAFDPRGVNFSTGIDCHATLQTLVSTDPSPDNEAEWKAIDDASIKFASDCAATANANLLPYIGTPNVARDMDRLRAGLGEAKLNYLGFSYGTALGAWYAELFPENVGRLVLDGAVDLNLSMLDGALEQAKGFEVALQHFFDWCKEDAARCPWTQGAEPAQAYATLQAAIEAQPIPAPKSDRALSAGDFGVAVATPLYGGKDGWRALAPALKAALEGDASKLMGFVDGYLERNLDGSYPNAQEAFTAVSCIDAKAPTVEELRAQTARFTAASPNFGLAALTSLLVCAHWPAQGKDLPAPRGQGAPPLLVLGTRFDPATPYAMAEALARDLTSSVLLTFEGEGHTAYDRGDSCIDGAVHDFLFAGKLPSSTCAASPNKGLGRGVYTSADSMDVRWHRHRH